MRTSAPRTTTSQSPQRLLAWTFRRDSHFLTCELLTTSDQRYAVILAPHWSGGTAVVEAVESGVHAFHRHAALAMQLRQQGWTVVAYALPSPRTPAPQEYPAAA